MSDKPYSTVDELELDIIHAMRLSDNRMSAKTVSNVSRAIRTVLVPRINASIRKARLDALASKDAE